MRLIDGSTVDDTFAACVVLDALSGFIDITVQFLAAHRML